VDGRSVLTHTDTPNGARIDTVGTGGKVVQSLGTIPNASHEGQIGYDQITDKYIVFIFNPVLGEYQAAKWRLYLWDRHSHKLTLVATNPADAKGRPLQSAFVSPELNDGYLYWIQSIRHPGPWGGSELMQYTISTGKTRVLYRGLTTAFVPYRSIVLFTGLVPNAPAPKPTDTDTPLQMYAVDQTTGKRVQPPSGITAGRDFANTIVTDGDLIVWTTDLSIRAWRPAWGRSISLIEDISRWPQGQRILGGGAGYPRLWHQFLFFDTGDPFVLDLKTDTFTRLIPKDQGNASDMSGSEIAIDAFGKTANGHVDKTIANEYLFSLRGLPDLHCSH
jgi:hypothetical protein